MTLALLIHSISDTIQKMEGWFPGSRSYKNNNPGNLWDNNKKRIWPNIPIDDKGFLIFPDYKTGRKALENDITIKVKRNMTLKELITMYAPPVENNTDAYIKGVATMIGISDINKKLLEYTK